MCRRRRRRQSTHQSDSPAPHIIIMRFCERSGTCGRGSMGIVIKFWFENKLLDKSLIII